MLFKSLSLAFVGASLLLSSCGGNQATTTTETTAPAATTAVAADTTATPATGVIYTCPMHPEVTSDKPGDCPKCGMHLIKKS